MHSDTINDAPAWARALSEMIAEVAARFGLCREAVLTKFAERLKQEARTERRRFTFTPENFPLEWPVAGANSRADLVNIASQGQRSQADPMLVEVVRFLARRAARQWFGAGGK